MAIESLLLGGAEVVMLQLSEELRSRGHTVFPIGPGGRDGWLRSAFRDLGFDFHTYDLQRPVDFECAERMAAQLAELDVHVVHSHEFVMGVYCAAAARIAGVRHVTTMHGNQQMLDRLQRRISLRWAIHRTAATVAVSRDTGAHLEHRLRLRPGTVRIIRNGIPDRRGDRRRVRRELGVGDDTLLILAVGSLMKRKGHRVLLEAMLQVDRMERVAPWRVVIAGEGAERADLEGFIAAHGLAERVRLLGNRNDVPDLQAASDIFVMPSLWEGLPLAVLEAMFAARPLIATTASGIPEAVRDGEEGLLIAPADAGALAQAVHRLLRDPGLRERLGLNARARAERDFSITAMADAYERLYRG